MKRRTGVILWMVISIVIMSSMITPKEKPSEMSKLMKSMLVYIQNEKQLIETNKPVSRLSVDAQKMGKAKITKGKKLSKNHKQYVDRFFEDLEKYYLVKDSSERIATFNKMVSSCITCHQHECPGPITVIKKNLFEVKE